MILLLLSILFLLIVPTLSESKFKYHFTSEMESEIKQKIQSIPTLQPVPLKIFPNLNIKLSNINFSIQYFYSSYKEEFLVLELNNCYIDIVFDLSLNYYNEESDGDYSDNYIELKRKGLSAVIDMYSPSFNIDGNNGWVSFAKGFFINKEISFNDIAEFTMFNDLIEYEKETYKIRNTLENLIYTEINRIFEDYPRSIQHEVFDGTWNEVYSKTHENLSERDCMPIKTLKFTSCKYNSTEKDYSQTRLLFKNVVFHVDFIYDKGGSYGKDVTYEVVYVGISQYLTVNGTTPITEGNCLVKIVGNLLYQGFLRYKNLNKNT